ncbi:MAG: hypothetical protein ACOZBZ_04080 [Patescibacteria group bacterium]
MISQSPKNPNRKLVIPIVLILFLLLGFIAKQQALLIAKQQALLIFVQLRKINLGFDFQLPKKEKIASPVSPPTEEEKLKNLLEMSGVKVEMIKSLDKSFEATLSGNLKVFFSREKDLSGQVASLQLILGRSKIEGKIPLEIDLRFDKPVLIY